MAVITLIVAPKGSSPYFALVVFALTMNESYDFGGGGGG